ncbi:MAG: SAM-dependent methyltransferase [Eubacteriales bacterium]|nr:SAM-dependent methyltransferase [Eubacteriales bacterium]
MSKKVKAIDRLLTEGFFETKEEALPYLLSGAVTCGGKPVHTGGEMVPAELSMDVRGLYERYVGKGGYKLEGALADFGVTAEGCVCIDAGACTGGFTDCLVQHGAALVYAVEVGYGQLKGSLAQNPVVVNLEKTNLGDEKLLALEPVPTLGSVDLSYLSLIKAVPLYRAIMCGQGELLCLVKPLFETESAEARRTGDLPDSAYEPLLKRLIAELNAQPQTAVLGVTHSHVTGNNGTREFFLHVAFGGEKPPVLDEKVESAVERALALDRYQKERK